MQQQPTGTQELSTEGAIAQEILNDIAWLHARRQRLQDHIKSVSEKLNMADDQLGLKGIDPLPRSGAGVPHGDRQPLQMPNFEVQRGAQGGPSGPPMPANAG